MVFTKLHLRLIRFLGVLVPLRLRADWRQEWEAELRHREQILTEWENLTWRTRLSLLWHSLGGFVDALWMQSYRWEDEMIQDLRFGVRTLLKQPGFALTAILILGLGIGANTAIFSFVNAFLLRPLPVEKPERLLRVHTGSSHTSYPNYLEFAGQKEIFSGVAAQAQIMLNRREGEDISSMFGQLVTGNYFSLLGVRAAMGRTFAENAGGENSVAVISYGFWERRMGGDPNPIGKTLTLNNRMFTIIGVTPKGFRGTYAFALAPEVWIPITMQPQLSPGADRFNDRGNPWVEVIGRLNSGVAVGQAQAATASLGARLAESYPDQNESLKRTRAFPFTGVDAFQGMSFAPAVLVFLGLLNAIVLLLLLISCANIAGLMLARAFARQKEIAIRLALGARRGRLLRQLLTESLLLALLGGAFGCLLAFWSTRFLQQLAISTPVSMEFDFSPDIRVLLYTLLVSVLTGLIFGLAPALAATRADVVPLLKDDSASMGGGSRRFNFRNWLVTAQIAVSFVLLICTGLFVRSLQNAHAAEPGFEVDHVLTSTIRLDSSGYTAEQRRLFADRLVERTEPLPGVKSVSVASLIPLSFNRTNFEVTIANQGQARSDEIDVNVNQVGPRYFETMGIGLIGGREFQSRDDINAPAVAIINETFARRYWPGEQPMGRSLRFPGNNGRPGPLVEIVGVVRDSKYYSLGESPNPVLYLPWAQGTESGMVLHVRTNGDPNQLRAPVRGVLLDLDRGLLVEIASMRENLKWAFLPARIGAILLGLFGLLGVTLAAVGIYGVISFSVGRKTQEIGVRMALGARSADVLRMILRQGMGLVLSGFAIGAMLALALTRFLSSLLVGVSATDPAAFIGVSVVLLAVASAACYLPARRAAKLDPMAALRRD